MSTRIVFADCETVAIAPGPATIWEIGLIVRDEGQDDTEYQWHIRPDLRAANPVSLRIGGYYERCAVREYATGMAVQLAGPGIEPGSGTQLSASALGVAHHLAVLLSGAHLVAANPSFDAGHIGELLAAHGECGAWDYHMTDLGSLVRGWAAGARGLRLPFPLKLHDAAKAAGINPDDYETHTALGDCRLARAVFGVVTGGAA